MLYPRVGQLLYINAAVGSDQHAPAASGKLLGKLDRMSLGAAYIQFH